MKITYQRRTDESLDSIHQFYRQAGYTGNATEMDQIFLCKANPNEIVGAVRFCQEEGCLVLRGMYFLKEYQGKGLGKGLLYFTIPYLNSMKSDCFAVPYDHLIHFYGQIGFQELNPVNAPPFLSDRLRSYRSQNLKVTLMKRPASKNIILETERTMLRSFTDNDLDALHLLHSDPNVMKYLVGGVRKNRDATAMDLKKYIDHEKNFGFGKWATIHKKTGDFIGRSGLVTVPGSEEIDLGYALHQKFWGQGYATEIAKALIAYCKKNLPARPIVGLIKEGNENSVKVLNKVGLQFSGTGNYFGESFVVYRT